MPCSSTVRLPRKVFALESLRTTSCASAISRSWLRTDDRSWNFCFVAILFAFKHNFIDVVSLWVCWNVFVLAIDCSAMHIFGVHNCCKFFAFRVHISLKSRRWASRKCQEKAELFSETRTPNSTHYHQFGSDMYSSFIRDCWNNIKMFKKCHVSWISYFSRSRSLTWWASCRVRGFTHQSWMWTHYNDIHVSRVLKMSTYFDQYQDCLHSSLW